MAAAEASSVIVSRRRLSARRRTVVWLGGEHDVSTVDALSETLAGAIAIDDCDLVVDLSEVQFMGAATIGVLIWARELLQSRSRSLVLRSPSRCARRILDLCGQGDLLEPHRVDATPATGTAAGALGTWVTVPTADRVDQPAEASAPDPSSAPDQDPVGRIPAAAVASVDADHRADERTAEGAGRGDRE
jgi:anti-anti-sigma factor